MIRSRVRVAMALSLAAGLALSTRSTLAEDRAFDGSNNNIANPTWGQAGAMLLRMTPHAYTDGFSAMPRAAAPNPRDISNSVISQTTSNPNSRFLSDLVWQWGQFIDHDLDITHLGTETASIPTSAADPVFHGAPIGFTRSAAVPGTGVSNARQHANAITSFIDASMVYGSDASTATMLRSNSGGRLLMQNSPSGALLPVNTMGIGMGAMPGQDPTTVFAAGDVRANEQPGLTAMHTLFAREHNRWADTLATSNPSWSDEQVYQTARKIVGAEIQKITYSDWIPALMGEGRLSAYSGYNASVNPSVATEFSTAAFRIGHTMLNGQILRLNNDGSVIPQGNMQLRNAFFFPADITNNGGISPLLKGMASQAAQEIDVRIVDDVREFLMGPFGPPGFVGFDLASLNIQRGRDHGLSDYNTMRAGFGLASLSSFSQITSDPALAALLQSMYGDINLIDPWVGMLAEDHLPGSSVGELMSAVILDQFRRTRDGDRFWYQNDADLAAYLATIEGTTLGDIIHFNTDLTSMQGNVFFIPAPGAGTLALLGLAAAGRRRRTTPPAMK